MEIQAIVLKVIDILAPIITGVLTAIFLKKKYTAEIEQLKANIASTKVDTRTDELQNVKSGISILMTEIVEPLKIEMNEIRRELARFRKAFAKGNDCNYYDDCPIHNELQRTETLDDTNAKRGT